MRKGWLSILLPLALSWGASGAVAAPETPRSACYAQAQSGDPRSSPVAGLALRFVEKNGGHYIDISGEISRSSDARPTDFRQRVFCDTFAQGVTCRAECDAGGLTIRKVGEGVVEVETRRLRLDAGAVTGRGAGCRGGADLARGGANSRYQLRRVPASHCAARK